MELTEEHIKYIKDLFKNKKPKERIITMSYSIKKELDRIFKEEFDKYNEK